MFANKYNDQGEVMCPGCDKVIVADGGKANGLTTTPKGMFIMHKACMLAWNERALLVREARGEATEADYRQVEELRSEVEAARNDAK